MSRNKLVEYRSTAKNGKSEVCKIMWVDPKWNTGYNYVGQREYFFLHFLKLVPKPKWTIHMGRREYTNFILHHILLLSNFFLVFNIFSVFMYITYVFNFFFHILELYMSRFKLSFISYYVHHSNCHID